MSHAREISIITKQEDKLVFQRFDELDAYAIGNAIRANLEAQGKGAFIEVRLWDRQLFCCAMKGTSADNVDWVRRKANVVKRFQKSSYRQALELTDAGKTFESARGTDPLDYASAGGSFPIRMQDGPVIGCVSVSGLPQREDHYVIVEAIAKHVGLDLTGLMLN